MEDLTKVEQDLLKYEQAYVKIQQDLQKHTLEYQKLLAEQQQLKKQFHGYNLKILSKMFDKLKINLYEQKDIYIYVVGFVYALKNNIFSNEQLKYFKLLGNQCLQQRSEKK